MDSSTSPVSYKISFSKADRSSEFLRNVETLRSSMELIDVVLVLDDGVEIPAHRLVLASASPYFRTMFNVDMRESCEKRIFLGDVDSASVKALVDFAYTGKIDVISDNDVALFCAAHRLLFEDVVDYCCEGLVRHMNKRTCLRWLKFADQYNCQKLLSVARRHAAFHIVDLAQTDEFRRLSLEHVSRPLTSDDLAVARQEEVWDIVLQWIQHDKENRKSNIEELAKSVRFSLIPEQFVQESVLSHPDFSINSSLIVEKISALERDLPSPHRLGKGLLAAGGAVNFIRTNTVEYYDHLWNVWKEFPSLNEERFMPGVFSLGESVYAVGGENLHSVERYDSTQGRWVEDVASMHESRTGRGVLIYGDCIYAMGCGCNLTRHGVTHCERYSPVTNSWTVLQPISKSARVQGTTVLNDEIYVFGSNYFCQSRNGLDVFKYDPVANRWLDVSFLDCSVSRYSRFEVVCADDHCLHLWREIDNDFVPFEHVRLDVRSGELTRFEIRGCPSFLDNFLNFYKNTYCLANGKEYSVGGVMRGDGHPTSDVQTFFWYDMNKEVAQYVEGPRLINKRLGCGVGAIDRCLTFNLF